MRYVRRISTMNWMISSDRYRRLRSTDCKAVGKRAAAEKRVQGLLRLDAKPNLEAVQADPGPLLSQSGPLLTRLFGMGDGQNSS